MLLFAAKTTWLNVWLTPLWLLGVGAALGLLILVLVWLLVLIASRRSAALIWDSVRQGPLLPIFVAVVVLSIFAVVGLPFAVDRTAVARSCLRLPFVGSQSTTLRAPAPKDSAADPPRIEVPISFRGDELRSFKVDSNADILISFPAEGQNRSAALWRIAGRTPFESTRGLDATMNLVPKTATHFIVQNVGDEEAVVTISVHTSAQHPQASSIAVMAISVVAVFAVYLLILWWMPKASAIALATAKSEMTQPLFMLLIGLGFFLLLAFMFIPYHTFGEDIKVLKDSGLTLIMVFAIFQTVWAASNSVAEEIEGKTAVTVLSKPISRRQFILGKFMGISWASAVMFIALGLWFLVIVAYKPIYDARESANTEPTWQACHIEVVRTIPGLVLAFMETVVFAAIGVAISTRLPLLANLVICFVIYALGHLTPLLVQAGGENTVMNVRFMAQFIATILPVLDDFNIQAAVSSGIDVPQRYLLIAAVYCALYSGAALLLALALFEDRDVA